LREKLLEFTLTTKDWGEVKILRPIPTETDSWGDLSPLKGTPWGDQLPIVSGEVFSHATHGHATPLMRVIGPPPWALMKKLPKNCRVCSLIRSCVMADLKVCYPCLEMPDCYNPPNVSDEIAMLASIVLLAWKENRYVVIVEGPEFGY